MKILTTLTKTFCTILLIFIIGLVAITFVGIIPLVMFEEDIAEIFRSINNYSPNTQ